MDTVISISEQAFSTDDLGRTVTTFTQVILDEVKEGSFEKIEEVIDENMENGDVEFLDYENRRYEMYGTVVKKIISTLEKFNDKKLDLRGEINDSSLYEVVCSY